MRFVNIAIFMFIFQLVGFWASANMLEAAGFTARVSFDDPTAAELATAQARFEEKIASSEVNSGDPVNSAIDWVSKQVQNAVSNVLDPLKRFVLMLPFMLMNLGVPSEFAYMIGTVYWLIMLLGIAEFITGRYLNTEA